MVYEEWHAGKQKVNEKVQHFVVLLWQPESILWQNKELQWMSNMWAEPKGHIPKFVLEKKNVKVRQSDYNFDISVFFLQCTKKLSRDKKSGKTD